MYRTCRHCGAEFKDENALLHATNEKELAYGIKRGFHSSLLLFQIGDRLETCPECMELFDE